MCFIFVVRLVEFLLFLRIGPSGRLLFLPEQILEDERAPNVAASVHQRPTLAELSEFDGCESELLSQIRYGSDRVLVVARQADDPMTALDDRIGCQGGGARRKRSAGRRTRARLNRAPPAPYLPGPWG